MKRFVALALTAVTGLLSGCATYDEYAYYERDGYYDDGYYGDHYDSRRYYYDEWGNRVYIDDYDVSRRYGYNYGSAAWGYPDYLRYNWYYSALWPTYRYYYDPYWSPGFYYGVTYFPRTYFGLNVGWYSWPYYQAYAPYRYSFADHYYDWADYSRGRAAQRQRYYGNTLPRYGSARNEAQALAYSTGARGLASTYYGNSAQPGGLVDPLQARQARARGDSLPFERGGQVEPYGSDGRGYGGFTGHGSPSNVRTMPMRGRTGSAPAMPQDDWPQTRSSRGYDRNSGATAPAPVSRPMPRSELRSRYRDPELDSAGSGSRAEPYRYERSRTTLPNREYESGTRSFQPRQTREPYDPVFERHVDAVPARTRPHYSTQPAEPVRSYESNSRPSYTPRGSLDRSSPSRREYVQPEPSATYARPMTQPSRPSYEPRPAPSYESRSAPSRFEPSRSDSSSSSSGSSRSSRGQLERIVRDDD